MKKNIFLRVMMITGVLCAIAGFSSTALGIEITSVLDGTDPLQPPAPFTNELITGTQTARLFRSGSTDSTCDTPKAAPTGPSPTGAFRFDDYQFIPTESGCVTIMLTAMSSDASAGLTAAVYNGAWDPSNPKQGLYAYTTDFVSGYGHKRFFSFRVTAGATYFLLVSAATSGATNVPYKVTISDSAARSSDFDGDGFADAAVFRPSTGTWFILRSSDGTVTNDFWGSDGDVPLDADFDGDGRTDVSVFRPSNGGWYIKLSHSGKIIGALFGTGTDKPSPGDYDHDGITDIAVFRPSTGQWLVSGSKNGFADLFGFNFGTNGDIPVGSERK